MRINVTHLFGGSRSLTATTPEALQREIVTILDNILKTRGAGTYQRIFSRSSTVIPTDIADGIDAMVIVHKDLPMLNETKIALASIARSTNVSQFYNQTGAGWSAFSQVIDAIRKAKT